MTQASRPSGRRPGASDTRAEILAAARRLFAAKGYDAATIRGIAREAEVDPALIHHYFVTKERLFAVVMEFPVDPSTVLPYILEGGPRSEIGERLARMFVSVWGRPEGREPFLALLRSAMTNEQAAEMIRQFLSAALLGRVAAALDVPPLRINAAAGQMVGAMMMRYVLRIEPIASASEDELVALLAPTLQRYLGES